MCQSHASGGTPAHAVSRRAGPGYLLVGDAAGFLDQFTGEGLYCALRGAALAADPTDRLLATGDEERFVGDYERARRAVFQSKEWLTRVILLFVDTPAQVDYAIARLARGPDLALHFGNVLGDLEPADVALRPAFLWGLLRP